MDGCCSGQLMAEGAALDAALFFTTGLLISLGHCLGMCGPLVTAFSLARGGKGGAAWRLIPSLGLYHAGRLLSYGAIGIAFSLVGSAARLVGRGPVFQGGLSLVAGTLMLLLGIGLLGWLPTRRWVESNRLAGWAAGRFGSALRTGGIAGTLGLGLANGFLPCGPVYAMAAGTMTAANPLLGAGAMMLFGLGTVPVLAALGLGAGRLAPSIQARFNRWGALLVLVLGIQLLLRGAAALRWIGHLRFGEVVIW